MRELQVVVGELGREPSGPQLDARDETVRDALVGGAERAALAAT